MAYTLPNNVFKKWRDSDYNLLGHPPDQLVRAAWERTPA